MKLILILEDDLVLATQWRRALELKQHKVFVTPGAEEALAVFNTQNIDVCIVDFMVRENGKPTANGGITFLGKMDPFKRRKTKILGVSGMTEEQGPIEAKNFLLTFGAQEFLQKPFTDLELVATVNELLLSET